MIKSAPLLFNHFALFDPEDVSKLIEVINADLNKGSTAKPFAAAAEVAAVAALSRSTSVRSSVRVSVRSPRPMLFKVVITFKNRVMLEFSSVKWDCFMTRYHEEG